MAEQKQHEASEKKLRDSRKQGKIAKSATVTQCCGATGVLLGVIFTMQASWVESQSLIELTFTRGFTLPSTLIVSWATLCAEILVIGFVIGGCIALVVEFLQTGFLFEISLVSPKASRINPVEGIKRIFGNLKRIWDPLLRCCFVLVIFSFFLNSIWKELVWTSWLDTNGQVKKVCQLATDCTLVFLFGYIALAIGDYFLQKKRFMRDISMSYDELKREMKDSEGDPLLKSRRRALHEELSTQDIIARVRASRVIIVGNRS